MKKNELCLNKMTIEKDECYTTTAEAEKLVNFLLEKRVVNLDTIIWLPFDSEVSRIYLAFMQKGFTRIIRTSLSEGKDFYQYDPGEFEIIISNPPFSKRTKLFARLFELDKPFVILQATQLFNNQNAVNALCEKDITLLMPRTRMQFMRYDVEKDLIKTTGGASFYSFWVAYKVFKSKKQFIALKDEGHEKQFEQLDVVGNHIEESQMSLFNWKE